MRQKVFDYSFLGLGLIIQIVTFFLAGSLSAAEGQMAGILSLVSGCLGICSVCLTAQGSIWTFLFGFGQVFTYTWLCWSQRFYGEIAINVYYFATMIYGVVEWRKHLKGDTATVTPRRLRTGVIAGIALLTLAVSWLAGWGLASWTNDTQPYLDAFTTIPALVAQVLMILVYMEHWYLWLAVDVLSVALWLRAGDYCMVAQYAFWCANCFYGLFTWRKLIR